MGAPIIQYPGDNPSEDRPEHSLPDFRSEERQSAFLGPNFYKLTPKVPDNHREFTPEASLPSLDGDRVEHLLPDEELARLEIHEVIPCDEEALKNLFHMAL